METLSLQLLCQQFEVVFCPSVSNTTVQFVSKSLDLQNISKIWSPALHHCPIQALSSETLREPPIWAPAFALACTQFGQAIRDSFEARAGLCQVSSHNSTQWKLKCPHRGLQSTGCASHYHSDVTTTFPMIYVPCAPATVGLLVISWGRCAISDFGASLIVSLLLVQLPQATCPTFLKL